MQRGRMGSKGEITESGGGDQSLSFLRSLLELKNVFFFLGGEVVHFGFFVKGVDF